MKCGRDAAEAAEWRDRYPGAVTMSHYVGRYGWNTVDWTGPVPDDEVRELIDASYDAAVAALPKSRRPQVASRRADAAAAPQAQPGANGSSRTRGIGAGAPGSWRGPQTRCGRRRAHRGSTWRGVSLRGGVVNTRIP